MFTLDLLGYLDEYNQVFDVENYKKTKLEKLKWLVANKKDTFNSELYYLFLEKEPDLIRSIEDNNL